MDTGYTNLIDHATRLEALRRTQETLADRPFTAGAFVCDEPGAPLDLETYRDQIELIQSFGGTPVIFQSYGLVSLGPDDLIKAYEEIGRVAPRFIAFELGTMVAPFGKIYDLSTYKGLLEIPQRIGAKHSSLKRALDWQRLVLRESVRPDFKVYTGNDLAIDMVMYGSDYLLGLSTCAPDYFALRDSYWLNGGAPWNMIAGRPEDVKGGKHMILDRTSEQRLGELKVGTVWELGSRRFRLVGLSEGIKSFTTTPLVFVAYNQVQNLGHGLVKPGETSYIVARLRDSSKCRAVVETLKPLLRSNIWT